MMEFVTGDVHMGGMIFWWLIAIAFVVLISVQSVKRTGAISAPSSASAEEVLRQRYAASDIDKAEYEERLEELRK